MSIKINLKHSVLTRLFPFVICEDKSLFFVVRCEAEPILLCYILREHHRGSQKQVGEQS